MKKILYGLLAFATAGALAGCLDEDPKYSQNNAVIFASETNAELALLGCYGQMTTNAAYGQMWQEVPIAGSGLSWSTRNGGDLDVLNSLNLLATNGEISSAWNGMYKAIAEINAFLANLESSSLDADVKTQMGGEARFLRAIAYYNLVAHFGDVPLKLIASTSDGISSPRTPSTEVFAQIIEDMRGATDIASSSSVGRLNSWAAKAFLGKVYYKMAMLGIDAQTNLTNAKECFDEVYEQHVYNLYPTYGALFLPWTDGSYASGNTEAIIQFNFNGDSEVCYNRGTNRFAPQSSTAGIAWGTNRVAKYAYDLHYGTYPGDPRVAVNFLSQWRSRNGNNQTSPIPQVGETLGPADSTYTYPMSKVSIECEDPEDPEEKISVPTVIRLPYECFVDPTNPTKAEIDAYDGENANEVKKLWNSFTAENSNSNQWPFFGKMYDQNATGTRSHMHLMVYRYSEMLLLMADVYNELNQKDRAIKLANEVLRRARESVSPAASQPEAWPSSLTKEQVTEKLYFERLFELMGEPSLYDMVRIRGTVYLEKLLLKNNRHEITCTSSAYTATGPANWQDRVFDQGQTEALSEEFLLRNLLMPIPSSEINANPAITNADNNYGYN